MTETPIYDQLNWEQRLFGIVGRPDDPAPTYIRDGKMYLGRPALSQAMRDAGEKMRDAFHMMTASGGSLSQEVSASSASRHSLQDSSRPEGSRPEMVIDSWANVVEFEIEYKEGDL